MDAVIISVGTELVTGRVVNTNAAYLSEELAQLGIDVRFHFTMDDDPKRLSETLAFACSETKLIVVTGGLGPTADDLTKETVCAFAGAELFFDEKIAEDLRAYFKKTSYIYTENNLKQAWIPKDGIVFSNPAGTAPGIAVKAGGCSIVCMPGVPREMKAMFRDSVRGYLAEKSGVGAAIYAESVQVFGVGESLTETMLQPLIDTMSDPFLATYAKEGIVEIRITSHRKTEGEAKTAVHRMREQVCDIMGDSVFSVEGKTPAQEVAKELTARGLSIACCEAPTAGLFASALAQERLPDACFRGGFVVRDAEQAVALMDVPEDTFAEYTFFGGAASEILAQQVYKKTGADLCIAVTGNPGPEPVGDCLPGMYSISILLKGELFTRDYYRKGRSYGLNREFMTQTMLDYILRILNGRIPSDVR